MEDQQFREAAREVIDYIIDYQRDIRDRPVLPSVSPGYLSKLVPTEAPATPDSWRDVMRDVERVIQPGMTHWHSPQFHAFCPLANSPPALLAELLAHGLSCVGLSWEAAPACLELEVTVMDWLARMLALPAHFLSDSGRGGGVIIGSATEGVVLTLTSEEIAAGNVPIYVLATLGTTGTCAFDPLDELGAVCSEYGLWLHVDAAYAGPAFVCPEFRHLLRGVEHVTSFSFNAHKWMLVNFECTALWVRDSAAFSSAHRIDAQVLATAETTLPNFRNWSLALGRRFRALKLWFVLRLYGVSGIQAYIRGHVALARQFEELVRQDRRFEVVSPASMGVVCFRVRGEDNTATERLLERVTAAGRVFMVSTMVPGRRLAARFVVVSRVTSAEDVLTSWREIQRQVGPACGDSLAPEDVSLTQESVSPVQETASESPEVADQRQEDMYATRQVPRGHEGLAYPIEDLDQCPDEASDTPQQVADMLQKVACLPQEVARPPMLRTKSGRWISELVAAERRFSRGMQ
ncbi:aromatic-L-amino-acid decarboxylase-like [Pollicipes pollicipes]|uniref:aromatic-L-amino-acid decarboxylase-like n=1 Tax=Pollicipes pollicipes TaxID=41117 RepID=UPI0018852C34|nr:aromatic-L-amino-acid decarboxylase-like [Pollicipes pollicipes]XP_037094160.1 aromatic-L-amino-acid decarboxylase-like [Pollicipes pollicipes]